MCFRPPKAQNHSYAVFLRTKPYNLPPPYFRLSHPKEGTLDMSNTSVSANAMICSKEYSVSPENWGFLFSSGVLNGASTQLHRFPIISFPFLNIFFFPPRPVSGTNLPYPIPLVHLPPPVFLSLSTSTRTALLVSCRTTIRTATTAQKPNKPNSKSDKRESKK